MSTEYAAAMTAFPLFSGFTPAGAGFILQKGSIVEHSPGQIIFREGDAATGALLVLRGKVEVYVERPARTVSLTELGPGAILGELAVLCGIPRSASVRASEPTVALHWTNEGFRQLLVSNVSLSERILRQSLRMLIEKEQALINSL